MYVSIPTYNSTIGEWSATEFSELRDFIKFVKSKIKTVGEYNLKNTNLWRQQAINYEKNGKLYTTLPEDTKRWREYWDFEKLKSKVGVIIDDFYITEHYYFYLNFCPIYNVLEQSTDWAEIWDSHYHYLLHKKLAKLTGKHTVITKKRRWGLSFLEVADIHRIFTFQRDSICKFICKDEDPNSKNFRILDGYRLFTDAHTAWIRPTTGSYPKIQQRIQQTNLDTKAVTYSGRMSIVESVVTKMQAAKGVGMYLTKGFWDEAGIQNNLIKSIQYNEKSVKQGGVVRGEIVVGGSVGELKDSENLKELIYNPTDYGFYAVEDEITGSKFGIFIPESYNYVDEVTDPDDEELIIGHKKFYDEDGNSDVDAAVKRILEKREKTKNKSPQAYRLELSQGPLTLSEAFDEREENIFPTHIIVKPAEDLYLRRESIGLPVELFYNSEGRIKHRIVKYQKVLDFPITRDTVREGCIMLYEPPPENPPLGLFYAGVDTVSSKKSTSKTSDSLMSVHIMKGRHSVEGEYGEKVLVAEWTGRCEDYEETYTRVQMLCEYYNAKSLVENNQESYIQWLISKKKQRLLIKAGDINNLRDILPNYSSNSSYGITTSKKSTEYIFDMIITYIESTIAKSFNDNTGDVTHIMGVHTIKDFMLLKEMLKWSPSLNTDRLISFGLALWAATIFTEQHHIKVGKKVDYTANMPKKRGMFSSTGISQFRKAKMF